MKSILILLLLSTAVLAGNGVWYPYPPSSGSGSGGQGNTGPTGASPWGISGSATYYTAGPVGVGTNNPSGPLVVSNNISASDVVVSIMGGQASAPASDILFDAEYSNGSSLSATYAAAGSVVPTATNGTPTVTSSALDLTANTGQWVEYDSSAIELAVQTGTIRFRYTPNYTGSPGSRQVIFNVGSFSTNVDLVFIAHFPDGNVYWDLFDSSGTIIYEIVTPYSAVSGTTAEFEFDWNVTSGASRVFVNGIQQGSTNTSTGTRSGTTGTPAYIGVETNLTQAHANYKITDLVVYNNVQHTSNFTSPIAPLGLGNLGQAGNFLNLTDYNSNVLASFDNSANLTVPNILVNNTLNVLGSDPTAIVNINGQSPLTGTSQTGFYSQFIGASTATSFIRGFFSNLATGAAGTYANVANYASSAPTAGGSSTITRFTGFYDGGAGLHVGSNNASVTDNVAYTGNWFINQSGTDPSSFAGSVAIGGALIAQNLAQSNQAVCDNGSSQLISCTGSQTATFGAITPANIVGTTTNNNAPAGSVGEYIESTITSPTGLPGATTAWGDATSISLTAGDWDVSGLATFIGNTSTISIIELGISTTSGNSSTGLVDGVNMAQQASSGTTSRFVAVPNYRILLGSTATIYLKMNGTYASGSPQYQCRLSARRVR